MDIAAQKILMLFMKCYCMVRKVRFSVKSLHEGKLGLYVFAKQILSFM
jgi:hypothetical protein